MTQLIEDYALIGNCETAALISCGGSMDWLGLPRFDSPACFAALLGSPENGRWLIAPADSSARSKRRYRGDTMVLETTFETGTGAVRVVDFMVRRDNASDVVCLVQGVRGSVAMRMELIARFDYGSVVPWVSRQPAERLELVAGPDRLLLDTKIPLRGKDMRTIGEFEVREGEEAGFALTWTPSFRPCPAALDLHAALRETEGFWHGWKARFQPKGEWDDIVLRSLLTLKALAHFETGGIVAAATTSLPEQIGGPRNWDYRYCWLRDATLTLYALMQSGFLEEAAAWRTWLLRAAAGSPDKLQIMYGVAGERRLTEYEVPWLAGYEGSAPVRVGNAAHGQRQLDVYGEVLDALYTGRRLGLAADATGWSLECQLVAHLETIWDQPDDGIWEVRGPRRHFTHSKVMAWVAYDRIIRSAQEFGLDGPVAHWIEVRDRIHDDVCRNGFDAKLNSFVQWRGAWIDACNLSGLRSARSAFGVRIGVVRIAMNAIWPLIANSYHLRLPDDNAKQLKLFKSFPELRRRSMHHAGPGSRLAHDGPAGGAELASVPTSPPPTACNPALAGPAPEQASSIRLDVGRGMAGHGLQRADLVPKENVDEAHAGSCRNQGEAADGRAPEAGPPAPGQHPSPQLI